MEDGAPLFGLGFSSPANSNIPSSDNDSSSSATTDALMKHYLQQCLDFHGEQQLMQEHVPDDSVAPDAPPQFISAMQQEKMPPPQPSDLQPPPTSIPSTADAAQQAMAKARAIVKKFQLQQQQQAASQVDSNESETCTIAPFEYRQRRERHFEEERKRLHKAMMKNFSHVARREEERLQLQLQQIQQSRQVEAQLHQSHSIILQQRQELQKKAIASSKAGIGTTRRNKLERKEQQQRKHHDSSLAIYLSGLPVDGSMTANALRDLFAAYGTILKVHLYRNKSTGQLKGDALVVYEWLEAADEAKEKRQVFLDTVCSQMTGAQLPCGSVLKVEPADPEYKAKQGTSAKNGGATTTDTGDSSYYGPASTTDKKDKLDTDLGRSSSSHAPVSGAPAGKDEQQIVQDATEELDDFFASLS